MVAGQDYPDWTAPQAHASAIAATGAPLLALPGTVYNSSQAINAGANFLTTPQAIDQISYEIFINAYQSGAGAAGPLKIQVKWFDASSIIEVAEQDWYIWPGAASGDHQIRGRGPTYGTSVILVFTNLSTVAQYTVQYCLYARSHVYTDHKWRSEVRNTSVTGVTLPVSDPTANALAFRTLSLAAAGTDTTELPLYSGAILLSAHTNSNTSDMRVVLADSADPNAEGSGVSFFQGQSDLNGNFSAMLALPRYQCDVKLTNQNAAATGMSYWLHAVE